MSQKAFDEDMSAEPAGSMRAGILVIKLFGHHSESFAKNMTDGDFDAACAPPKAALVQAPSP